MQYSAINVNALGKKYNIQQSGSQYLLLSETIKEKFKTICSLNKKYSRNTTFWALKDITFTVEHGDVLGIIGKNGAGKSTLLKILSRVASPTEGTVEIRGHVGSLLEVGTGFHPELTGRENIFLSGSILGMRKTEIESNFDNIVKFADIEKFIDTPVKRYSSGMLIRLGFAVASHLNPDILIVDEVLAVGDAQFQKKCLGKMDQISKSEGRTILFVSHSMSMISSLCSSGILLEKGSIKNCGSIEQVINSYLNTNQVASGEVIFNDPKPGDKKVTLHSIRIQDPHRMTITDCRIDEPFIIEMEYEIHDDNLKIFPNLHIRDSYGQYVFITSDSALDPDAIGKIHHGRYISKCTIPGNFLNSGTYYIGIALTSVYPLQVRLYEQDVVFITINDPMEGIPTRINGYSGSIPGPVRPLLQWELQPIKI
jgi:lipopolysaccharide transport system ATP-binding protein